MKDENTSLRNIAMDLALEWEDGKPQKISRLMEIVRSAGVYPASIHPLYKAMLEGKYPHIAIPAINIRGLTFDIACAVWKAALKLQTGPVIFELAPYEGVAGNQSFAEYSTVIQAAAIHEGYRGPVFLQADLLTIHNQDELASLKQLIDTAINAGMYNLDLNASPLIQPDKKSPLEQHELNAGITAELTRYAFEKSPGGIHPSIGGEVGGINTNNTSPKDLRAFMEILSSSLAGGKSGLDKISARTGAVLGGIINSDGSMAEMPLDVALVEQLSGILRAEYNIAGLVQHGASTLSPDILGSLASDGVIEAHLGTKIQNIVFDHAEFPEELMEYMRAALFTSKADSGQKKASEKLSGAQRYYQTRFNAWGMFKEDLWALPEKARQEISLSLQNWFEELFIALNIAGKKEILTSYFPAGE